MAEQAHGRVPAAPAGRRRGWMGVCRGRRSGVYRMGHRGGATPLPPDPPPRGSVPPQRNPAREAPRHDHPPQPGRPAGRAARRTRPPRKAPGTARAHHHHGRRLRRRRRHRPRRAHHPPALHGKGPRPVRRGAGTAPARAARSASPNSPARGPTATRSASSTRRTSSRSRSSGCTRFSLTDFTLIGNIVDDPGRHLGAARQPLPRRRRPASRRRGSGPATISYGTTGIGSDDHLAMLALERADGRAVPAHPLRRRARRCSMTTCCPGRSSSA